MLGLFQRLAQEIEKFVEQRDDLLMLVACSDNDSVLVLGSLGDIEQANASDVFLVFPDAYHMPGPYVSVAVERLREQHNLACDALKEEGREPPPPLPEELSDDEQPAADRLKKAILFARSLVPKEGGHRLVWGMFPPQITDLESYVNLISAFVPRRGIEPWMAGLRLIFRVPADIERQVSESSQQPRLSEAPRTRICNVDLGPDALQEGMAEDAANEELSDDDRMQSFLSLALLDSAHGEYDEAMDKFDRLLGYYQHTKNLAMQAFVMSSIGDMYFRQQQFEQAQHWYECAVPPVIQADSRPIFFSVTRNLGRTAFELEQYGDAEQYFDGADKLAADLNDPQGKADALEWCGLSQEKQEKIEAAVASWENARTLSRSTGMADQLSKSLGHLERIYTKQNLREQLQEVREEQAALSGQETTA